MALCKRKRGELSVLLKYKVRVVLCGNQVIAADARRAKLLDTHLLPPLRTHSPTVRHCTYKLTTGAAVVRRMRRRGFDVKWAYLQGEGKFMGKKVWAEGAPPHRLPPVRRARSRVCVGGRQAAIRRARLRARMVPHILHLAHVT